MTLIAVFLTLIVASAIFITYLVTKINSYKQLLAEKSNEVAALEADKSSLQADRELAVTEKSISETKLEQALLTLGTREELLELFKKSVEDTGTKIYADLKRQGSGDANKELVEVISPFKTSLEEQSKALKEFVSETGATFSSKTDLVGERATQAVQAAEQAAEKVVELTNLLRGDVQKVGQWGEMLLERILEASGLEKNVHFQMQPTVSEEDTGKKLRADCLFIYPGDRYLIIDAKVPLLHYQSWLVGKEKGEKQQAQKSFTSSVKAHVQALAKKSYPQAYQKEGKTTHDYVVLFMPNEAALSLAMQDSDLWTYATQRKIIFAVPSTLLLLAETLLHLWYYAKREKNLDTGIEMVGAILGKMEMFMETVEGVGKQLTLAQDKHRKAEKLLFSGRGNLKDKCEKLKSLGIKRKKISPKKIVDDSQLKIE